ncbi:hypothetical protein H9P43_003190 [Blastocladiella emersonii ATCC 22665]|nr:hypothetical protein H9P43_003190 [Blastocladiella emersonii ATCC 22665]
MLIQVDLFFACKDLVGNGLGYKCNPVILLYLVPQEGVPVLLGRTERIEASTHPMFTTPIMVDYSFESTQLLRVVVLDAPSEATVDGYTLQHVLGEKDFAFGEMLRADSGIFTVKPAKQGRAVGQVAITPVPRINSESLHLTLAGEKLDKKDFFGSSDPYFVVYRLLDNGEKHEVYRSETIMNNINPTWDPVKLPLSHLVNVSDPKHLERSICITVFDWDRDTEDDIIGSTTVRLAALVSGAAFSLINHKKLHKSRYENSGKLYVRRADTVRDYSFTDYLRGGAEISVDVAIDFSSHNGGGGGAASPHELDPSGAFNDYERALDAVLTVLQPYDADQHIPVYGFGATMPGFALDRSDDFHASGDASSPYVTGKPEVLAAYRHAAKLASPLPTAHLAPIISKFSYTLETTRASSPLAYHILLILTQGAVADVDAIAAAVRHTAAANLPLSVVVVGVGNGEFADLQRLDATLVPREVEPVAADKKKSKNKEDKADGDNAAAVARDIFHFVRFNEFAGRDRSELLTRELLRQIPSQVVDYFQRAGVVPNIIE